MELKDRWQEWKDGLETGALYFTVEFFELVSDTAIYLTSQPTEKNECKHDWDYDCISIPIYCKKCKLNKP